LRRQKMRAEKKSLEEAMRRARKVSKEYPEEIIRVMDKKGRKATYTSSNWIYKERVLEGYYTVAVYKNGKKLS